MPLYKFQGEAVRWRKPKPKAYLAMEQGTGKTIVSCVDADVSARPGLVVVPASALYHWQREFAIWRPEITTHIARGGRHQHLLDLPAGNVLIVSYGSLLHPDKYKRFGSVIFDESHYLKGHNTKRSKFAMKLIPRVDRALLLSGTPMPNRPIELWPMLHTLGATRLNRHEFGMRYAAGWLSKWGWDYTGASRLDELRELLTPWMFRVEKDTVLDLPPKMKRLILLDLPVDERERIYDPSQIAKNRSAVAFEGLSTLMKLSGEAKIPAAVRYIIDQLEEGSDKVVVFAHHLSVLDGLEAGLLAYKPVRIDGSVSSRMRQTVVDRFQRDPTVRVFLGQTSAAGEVITLTAARHVIIVEGEWTPARMEQAIDRCHRIGATRPVIADILAINGSIDHRVIEANFFKQGNITQVIKENHDMKDDSATVYALARLSGMMDVLHILMGQVGHCLKTLDPEGVYTEVPLLPVGASTPAVAPAPAPAAAPEVAPAATPAAPKPAAPPRAPRGPRKAATPQATPPAATPPAAAAAPAPAAAPPAPVAQASNGAAAPTVAYDAVRSAATALIAKRGRASLLGVWDALKVSHGNELAPERYPEAIEAINAAME